MPLADSVGKGPAYPLRAIVRCGLSRLKGDHVKSTGQICKFCVALQEKLGSAQQSLLFAIVHRGRCCCEARVSARPNLNKNQVIILPGDQVDLTAAAAIIANEDLNALL